MKLVETREKMHHTADTSKFDTELLVYFHGGVNFVNKGTGTRVAHGTTHDAQAYTEHAHIAEIECGLE